MSRIPKPLNLATLLLLIASGVSILPVSFAGIVQPVQAQTESDRKAEAERLLNLCREHLSQNQAEAAIQSCQQAVTAHQQIKDRSGEAKSTVNLGIAYGRSGQSILHTVIACTFFQR